VSGVGVVPPSANMVTVTGGTLPQGSELAGQSVLSFRIGKYEVTWGEWKAVRDWAVTNNKGYDLANVGYGWADNLPVFQVSWYDVVKWCNAKSEKEGRTPVYTVNAAPYKTGEVAPSVSNTANGYRLPSEKEWEWAARGGVETHGYMYSGSNTASSVAWYFGQLQGWTSVGQKAPNELGIYDMSGSVHEWYGGLVVYNSLLVGNQSRFRGGSFNQFAEQCKVSHPGFLWLANNRNDSQFEHGFRLARNSEN
jgi:sulfatase modifying factor 1